MKITFGKDFFEARAGKQLPIVMDTQRLINAHLFIVGSSGVGKSHTFRRMINEAVPQGNTRFHVFDVHGDLTLDGASTVTFSEQTPYGLHPLRINPKVSGSSVRKCINNFIRIVNQASSTALGVKQEAVLRNLLLDVFNDFGFNPDDPSTWTTNALDGRLVSGGGDNRLYLIVPLKEKDEAKGFGARWDPDKKLWWIHTENYRGGITKWSPAYKERAQPTVADVLAYATRLYEERFLGSDQKAVRALSAVNRQAKAMQRRMLDDVKHRRAHAEDPAETEALETARDKAISAFSEYVNAVRTGDEFQNLLKYESPDVLKSVVDRLSLLQATGIFRELEPPFDQDAPVWRYKINELSHEEKKMFVLFRLQELFADAMQRGETTEVVDVVVLDELSTYTSTQDEEGDGIIGVIAREARKFGMALWAANQTPVGIPESLLSSVAVKIILGLDEFYWQQSVNKLRVDLKLLEWIRPHHTMAVQMKERGALKTRWWWTMLN